MNNLWVLSCVSLALVATVCAVAVLTAAFRDNLMQRVGFMALSIGCAARVEAIWASESVMNDWVLVHVGMALIAAGAVLRIVGHWWKARKGLARWRAATLTPE